MKVTTKYYIDYVYNQTIGGKFLSHISTYTRRFNFIQ